MVITSVKLLADSVAILCRVLGQCNAGIMVQKLPGLGYLYAFVIILHPTDEQNPTNWIILLWACPHGVDI
jgi:TctA family transporter